MKVERIIGVVENENLIVLRDEEIVFIEKVNRKTQIHTEDGTYETSKSLEHYENRLKKSKFFRSHRSCLVNLSKIEKCVPQVNYTYDIYFKDIEPCACVSRANVKKLKEILDI